MSPSLQLTQPYETVFAQVIQTVQRELGAYLHGERVFPRPLDPAQENNIGASTLWDALRYSSLNNGKLVRPVLCIETAMACSQLRDSAVGKTSILEKVLPTACAIELVHTQSLIHDDLPCMDNDDLRRGRPTLHKQYNESTAVLAGDALLAMAFGLISHNTPIHSEVDARRLLQVIGDFSAVSSVQGLVNGQYVDIDYENKPFDESVVNYIHNHKTGALFRFSTRAGAMLANASEDQITQMTRFGETLGLAFQIVDDLLDIDSDAETLGKTVGKDQHQNKATYPALMGVEASKKRARALTDEALSILAHAFTGPVDRLEYLANFMIERIR